MKKWRMNIQAITEIEVEADSYADAIEKGVNEVDKIADYESKELKWSNFKVIPRTVEMVAK